MTLHGPITNSFISQRLRLNYVDWGNPDAPPLLLVHGGRDHARSWDWVAEELRHDWHIIAPDLRGHGDSAWSPDGNYEMSAFVYDLAQLIHQLNLAPVSIIAHSMGGNIATRYAGLYPENVRKMVNRVPPAMRNGWSFFEKSGEMSAADYAKILKDTAIGKGNWEEFFPAATEASEAELNPYYELTSRQRSIISLLAQGISVQEISVRLDLTYAYVRKELSRAYDILLPDAKESDDLKTLAILKYLQLVKTI